MLLLALLGYWRMMVIMGSEVQIMHLNVCHCHPKDGRRHLLTGDFDHYTADCCFFAYASINF